MLHCNMDVVNPRPTALGSKPKLPVMRSCRTVGTPVPVECPVLIATAARAPNANDSDQPAGCGLIMLDRHAGMSSCMLAQQVEQAASVDEFQRLVLGEVVGVHAVAAGANQDVRGAPEPVAVRSSSSPPVTNNPAAILSAWTALEAMSPQTFR